MNVTHKLTINLILTLLILFSGCQAQSLKKPKNPDNQKSVQRIGGNFENSEYIYQGLPNSINSVDTSAGWSQDGQKILITGNVYQLDGKTPAPDVLIYYYHTNTDGKYISNPTVKQSITLNAYGQTHGYIRGWVKSDSNGKYSIYTVRPGSYPTRSEPAHIHITIKEPNELNEYYIDNFVFDDDPLLIPWKKKKPLENRGGSGILRVLIADKIQIAEHNIIIGLNITNYPQSIKSEKQSGLHIGEDNPSFMPYHAFGPDKGTRTCPVCKYGRYHGIVFFVGNHPNWEDIKKWLSFLDKESETRNKYLKAYFVYGNAKGYSKSSRENELEKIGQELQLKNIALTFVPSLIDSKSEVDLNNINPSVENTFVIYRHRAIIDKFIDLKPSTDNFKLISTTLDKTRSVYFDLPEPKHD